MKKFLRMNSRKFVRMFNSWKNLLEVKEYFIFKYFPKNILLFLRRKSQALVLSDCMDGLCTDQLEKQLKRLFFIIITVILL